MKDQARRSRRIDTMMASQALMVWAPERTSMPSGAREHDTDAPHSPASLLAAHFSTIPFGPARQGRTAGCLAKRAGASGGGMRRRRDAGGSSLENAQIL